jgi:hypothetical protein
MFGPQRLGQVAVDFDHRQVIDPVEQRPRQRTVAGTDLDQPLASPGVYRIDNARYVMPVDQKILAEAFAGAVLDQARYP